MNPPLDRPPRPPRPPAPCAIACLSAAALLGACAPLPPQPPPPVTATVELPTPVQPVLPAQTVFVQVPEPGDLAARHLLAYHERVSKMGPGELALEATRLGDGSASPQATMELAIVLGATRGAGDLARASGLLDKLLRNGEPAAQAWSSLARLLATRYAEQRRAEEQVERLSQQLRDTQRDNQRRLEQLNEKLEALKAIERSLNSRPAAGPAPTAPAASTRPAP